MCAIYSVHYYYYYYRVEERRERDALSSKENGRNSCVAPGCWMGFDVVIFLYDFSSLPFIGLHDCALVLYIYTVVKVSLWAGAGAQNLSTV
jgi:hypothetical protein